MNVVFSDQAWSIFSSDAKDDGIISQYVVYIIEKIRKDAPSDRTSEEKTSQLGNTIITYGISKDRIIIKSIEESYSKADNVECNTDGRLYELLAKSETDIQSVKVAPIDGMLDRVKNNIRERLDDSKGEGHIALNLNYVDLDKKVISGLASSYAGRIPTQEVLDSCNDEIAEMFGVNEIKKED